jgi:uncharacterized protein (TIGR03435 family)
MRLAIFCIVVFIPLGSANLAEGQTFDVASVKPFSPEIKQPYTITGGPGTDDPIRFRAPRIGMTALLTRAFDVSTDQITGPAWLRDLSSSTYTVVATMPPGTTKEQFRTMLQNLLAERFHLVFHRETRSFPGYALVVDKGGPKFKEVASAVPADPPPDTRSMGILGPRGPDDFPTLPPGPRTVTMMSKGGGQRTKYQERTMAEFVSNLGFLIGTSQGKGANDGYLQPRVVDKTGLAGRYTFLLEYSSEGAAALARQFPLQGNAAPANSSPLPSSDPGSGLPTIFVAIQKQLGLRLDKVPNVPLDMIVVESVDKVPTPD